MFFIQLFSYTCMLMLFEPNMLCLALTDEETVFMKLRKEVSFNDKLLTNDMLGNDTTDTLMNCASLCVSQPLCVSLFYNKHSLLCQTHSLIFTDATSSLVSVNTSYYHITRGNSVLEPIKECDEPPAETGVTWDTGTKYLTSRRHYSCVGSLLPKVSEVECMTSGNWTLMSGFCKDLESCADVQTCSSTNVDGTYQLYPPVLGGQGVQIYCHDMATDPKAYVTLFEENLSRNDFSLRTSSSPCTFEDRVGDATASFNKINVNTSDMSVNASDLTFANTCQESPNRSIPEFGMAGACALDYFFFKYTNCPAPGLFIINTNGTGLKVSPDCTWTDIGASWGSRIEPIEWSPDGLKIQTRYDAWCGTLTPVEAIYLEYTTNSDVRGTAITPVCPP